MKVNRALIYNADHVKNRRRVHEISNIVFVKIETDEGIYGLGEAALPFSGSGAVIEMITELCEKYVIGENPFMIEAIWDRMFRQTFIGQGGGPIVYSAMSAIDEALWDIKGKALDVPVYELLGGKVNDRLEVYANGWCHSGLTNIGQYVEAVEKIVDDGYRGLKFDPIMFHPDGTFEWPRRHIDDELMNIAVERVKTVRKTAGSDFKILIEIHGNLGTTDAIRLGRRLEEYNIFFYEEPVDAMNVECMKKVSENVHIPIAGGERLYTRYQFRPYLEQQALDIIQPDIGMTGGLTEAKKIASHAETYNICCQPHNSSGPISTAVAVQLDACMTNFIIQEIFPFFSDGRYNIVDNAYEQKIQNGYITISNRKGLGIELDEEYVNKFDHIAVK